MTEIRVRDNPSQIPLIELSGRFTERDGAELADKVMKAIYYATDVSDVHPYPLSLPQACVRAPRT